MSYRDLEPPGPWLGSDSVASRPQVMVTVGVTPDDSSSPDTVCMDAGYPKVSVSLVGLEVASVHPPCSVTHHYFIGGESELRVFHRSVITVSNTAVDGGPVVVHSAYPHGSGSVHATGESCSQSTSVRRELGIGACLAQCNLRIRVNQSTDTFAILSHNPPLWVLEGIRMAGRYEIMVCHGRRIMGQYGHGAKWGRGAWNQAWGGDGMRLVGTWARLWAGRAAGRAHPRRPGQALRHLAIRQKQLRSPRSARVK